jgi:hypothetical protein
MSSPGEEGLDGLSRTERYADGTLVRVFVMRTGRDAYPSGWAYRLHYGTTVPDPPRTLEDGTIRRYDNSHERRDTNSTKHPIRTPNASTSRVWRRSGSASGARFRKTQSTSNDRP